jgi:hypothetical protein
VLIWGCPKRQTTVRVVYAPAPPAAATPTPAGESRSLVIEEPPPPEPAEVAPAESGSPRPTPRRRRPLRTEPLVTTESAGEPVEPPPTEVPALEPRESPGRQTALRQQILDLQERLRQRAARLDRLKLPSEARKTLDDARTFLAQSERALLDGDLQRARNLADKASLLVSALEQLQ